MKRSLGLLGGLFSLLATMLFLLSCTPVSAPGVTPPPSQTPVSTPPSTPVLAQTPASPSQNTSSAGVLIPSATLNISAQNFAFDRNKLTIHTNTRVTLVFDNKDNMAHNVAIYTNSSATSLIFRGDIISGPGIITYEFTAPAIPGTYFFRCDIHPAMTGSFIVTQ